jgi:hypothetical protein
MLRPLLALAALAVLPLSVHADEAASTVLSCQGADEVAVQVEATDRSASTLLQIAGLDVPALRGCMGWAHGNPRIGASWRCPHGAAGSQVRYEIYPMLRPANGDKPFVHIVKWDGSHVVNIDLKNCE